MQPLFEDNHYIALLKPAGISTEPHFEDQVRTWIKVRDQKPGNVFLKATHRLDRPASGIVLFAKTDKGLMRMHGLLRERAVQKTYYALVQGKVEPEQGTWRNFLTKGEKRALIDRYGKEAILDYQVEEYRGETTLLKCSLITGRYHQIRIQAYAHGYPVVGDTLYQSGVRSRKIALFHAKMEFIHPIKGNWCIIQVDHPF